jgi:hypothetical protein
MLKGSLHGILLLNGVPRRGGGIRPPMNGTKMLEPSSRSMDQGEEYMIEQGASAKIRLPNGTVVLMCAEVTSCCRARALAMGAWGYEPMENDYALEWLANEVQGPLLATIKRTLQAYLDQTDKDDDKSIEAEAAAALLVELTGDHAKRRSIDLNCGWLAKQQDLWSLAASVIRKLMVDKRWINDWNEPKRKMVVLEQLLSNLQHSKEAMD